MAKPHKRFLTVAIILSVICIVSLAVIDKKWTQPIATSAVTSPYTLPKQASLTLIPENYIDNYVSFDYPSIMTAKKPPQPTLPVIDNATFSYPDDESWLLAIAVYKIPSGNFNNNSAYQARIVNPSVYKLSQSTINGISVPIFTNVTVTGYSRVAFLISGDYQATVSLIGDDINGVTPLANTMAMVLNSWQWQGSY